MYTVRKVTDDLYWVGGNDHRHVMYESARSVPGGVSNNAYLLMDEKNVLFNTVDWSVSRELIRNIEHILEGNPLDYIVINHSKPLNACSIEEIVLRYPNVKIISNDKTFIKMRKSGISVEGRADEVMEGDFRCFGRHTFTFIADPMINWPDAMAAFDFTNAILFSSDSFGSFGAMDSKPLDDGVDFHRDWVEDVRLYLNNIVGKCEPFVQSTLNKDSDIDIKIICPLHGPVWRSDFGYIDDKYDNCGRYEPEEKGVMIVYASIYGNTEHTAHALASRLYKKGLTNVVVNDVSKTHVSNLISETLRLSHIVLASVPYSLGIYPPMHNYLMDMKALNLQNRTFAIVESGAWAPGSGNLMREFLKKEMKRMTVLDETMTVTPSVSLRDINEPGLDVMADSIIESIMN